MSSEAPFPKASSMCASFFTKLRPSCLGQSMKFNLSITYWSCSASVFKSIRHKGAGQLTPSDPEDTEEHAMTRATRAQRNDHGSDRAPQLSWPVNEIQISVTYWSCSASVAKFIRNKEVDQLTPSDPKATEEHAMTRAKRAQGNDIIHASDCAPGHGCSTAERGGARA